MFNNEFFMKEKPRGRGPLPGRVELSSLRENLRINFYVDLLNMKMSSMFNQGRIRGYNDFVQSTGIPFTQNEYLMQVTAGTYAREKYGNRMDSNGKTIELYNGVYSKKSKSKIFRRFLEKREDEKQIMDLQVVKTFFQLIDVPIPNLDTVSQLHCIWNRHYLSNKIRTFAFQFFNNSLPVGARLGARYRANPNVEIDERCTFCTSTQIGAPAREDFVLLFFHCGGVTECIECFFF